MQDVHTRLGVVAVPMHRRAALHRDASHTSQVENISIRGNLFEIFASRHSRDFVIIRVENTCIIVQCSSVVPLRESVSHVHHSSTQYVCDPLLMAVSCNEARHEYLAI